MKAGRTLKLTKKLIADLELALAELLATYAAASVEIYPKPYYSYELMKSKPRAMLVT